jgi:hypothetical protein
LVKHSEKTEIMTETPLRILKVRSRYPFPFEHMLLRPRASRRRVPDLLYGSVKENLSLADEGERVPICCTVQIIPWPIWEKRCHTQPPSQFDAEEGLNVEGLLKAPINLDEWGEEKGRSIE